MVLAMAVSDWLYAVCSLRRLCHRAAGLHKRQHDACSHATGPCYAMLGPCAEALHHPVDLCHWAVWLHLRESVFFFFRLLRFKPPKPARTSLAMVLHAHVMLAVVVPLYQNSLSITSCALLASKSAWPLVLTPATLQSAAQSIGSQQRAQLYPGTVPGPDDSPPSDNLPRPLPVNNCTSMQC